MTQIAEIAPDVYRICTFIPEINLQFNQFLVCDEQPLLFHTGMKGLFPIVRDAVASLVDPASIQWIGFSHFEADECGSLNEWQTLAPAATTVCSFVGKVVSVDDVVSLRPRGRWKTVNCFTPANIVFAFSRHPMSHTAGRRVCCLRKHRVRCSAPTCSMLR